MIGHSDPSLQPEPEDLGLSSNATNCQFCAFVCYNKIPQRSGLNRNILCHMSGGWKSEIRLSVGLVSQRAGRRDLFMSLH